MASRKQFFGLYFFPFSIPQIYLYGIFSYIETRAPVVLALVISLFSYPKHPDVVYHSLYVHAENNIFPLPFYNVMLFSMFLQQEQFLME